MIVQGSNNPLVIQFDEQVEGIPRLVVTLWRDRIGSPEELVKKWEIPDMVVSGDTVVCSMEEQDTAVLPPCTHVIEVKGLDLDGNTIFWEEYKIGVKRRRDRVIRLTRVETGV